MSRKLILSFCCFFNLFSQAQNQFNYKYFSDESIRAEDLLIKEDTIVVFGNTFMNVANEGFFHQIDADANVINTRYYSSALGLRINKAAELNDSTFFAVGELMDPLTMVNNAMCFKLTGQGDIIWSRTFGDVQHSSTRAFDVIQLVDSSIIVVGNSGNQGFSLSLSPTGDLNWSKLLHFGNVSDVTEIKAVASLEDSSFVLVGSQAVFGQSIEGILLKMDALGNAIWAKINDQFSTYRDVYSMNSALYIFDEINASLTKFNSLGNVTWSNVYANFNAQNEGNDMSINEDGLGNILLTTNDFFYGHVIQVDTLGNELSDLSVIGKSIESLFKSDGSLIVLGNGPVYGVKSSFTPIPHFGIMQGSSSFCSFTEQPFYFSQNTNIQPVSFNFTGSLITTVNAINIESLNIQQEEGCIEILGELNEWEDQSQLSIYPNPSTGEVVLTSNSSIEQEVNVFDAFGKLCATIMKSSTSKQIDLSYLVEGVYFVQVENEVRKLVIKK
jgi:hypothetical protein